MSRTFQIKGSLEMGLCFYDCWIFYSLLAAERT